MAHFQFQIFVNFLGSMHKRSADVQTYNPGERSALLGKGPRASVTHYTQVSGAQVGRTAAKVNKILCKDQSF